MAMAVAAKISRVRPDRLTSLQPVQSLNFAQLKLVKWMKIAYIHHKNLKNP